ncbi:unnamed protein product [Durusdinium trenchii]|uniref:Uncharacterized protein n=1 Tax=Durusdinium trenchii TaxID=1381693 RepID=A0ABP0H5S5_9DINO
MFIEWRVSPEWFQVHFSNVLHLDLKAIPTVACPANAPRGAEADLEETNSWLLDYLIHGQRRYLWEDNGLNATKAYKLIDDFIQMLKKAERALQAFAPKEDLVLNTMSKLALELADRQKRVQKQ